MNDRKKPTPIPLLTKVAGKLETLKGTAEALVEDFSHDDEPRVSALRAMAHDVALACSALEAETVSHLPAGYIKPKRDHWLVPVGATVTIEPKWLAEYSEPATFRGEVLFYAKRCKVRNLDDNSIMFIERAHLSVLEVPVTD